MDSKGKSIILEGKFDPVVYHPERLFSCGVENRVLDDQIRIVSCNEIATNFTIQSTNYFIENNRFILTDNVSPIENLTEKLNRLFSLQPYSVSMSRTINLLGFIHFELENYEQWLKISGKLAPVNVWDANDKKTKNLKSGLLSLSMLSDETMENYIISKIVKIEPSLLLESNTGVFVQVEFRFKHDSEKPALKLVEQLSLEAKFRLGEADNVYKAIREIK